MKSKYCTGRLGNISREGDEGFGARYVLDDTQKLLYERTGFLYINSMLYCKILKSPQRYFLFTIKKKRAMINKLVELEMRVENKL